jgi:prepilin-type N-terminal cleavage/methylation domain-containing protein
LLMKMRGQMQKGHNQKGFTLVELMVVVVIIGILVAIAVPVYNNVTAKANRGAVEANLRTIDSAIMQYNATKGLTKIDSDGITAIKVDGSYLQKWPTGPDKVSYDVNSTSGKAEVTKDTDTGAWFSTASPASLPITW